MPTRHTHRPVLHPKSEGFTLIELLVVIAIIGLLASIILASLNTARDRAKIARAESDMHNVFLKMSECMLTRADGFPYCYGTAGDHDSSFNCGGGIGAIPVRGTAVCGDYDTATPGTNPTDAKWPDVSSYDYVYRAYAFGNRTNKAFDFEIYKSSGTPDVICCTQNGCSHITDADGSACRAAAGL